MLQKPHCLSTVERVTVEPTAAFAQLQLGFVNQTQWCYEVIRPLVLFADRNAAQQEYQRGWALAGLFKDGVGQERIVAVTRATTVGREVALLPEESALGAMTVRACKPIRMQVTLQPDEAEASIQQFGNREINHIGMIPRYAR
jgi:hypothetical protein